MTRVPVSVDDRSPEELAQDGDEALAALEALLVAYKGVEKQRENLQRSISTLVKEDGAVITRTRERAEAAESDLQAAKEALGEIQRLLNLDDMSRNDHEAGLLPEETLAGIAETLARLSTGTQDGQEVIEGETPDTKGRVFELAAIVARLVCVEDAQHVDDRDAHRRLDLAANKLGHLLRLPEPEFAEVWSSPPGIQDGGEG